MRRLFLPLLLLAALPRLQAQYFSRQQIQTDIDSMIARIEAVHYDPYLLIPKPRFRNYVDSIARQLPDSMEAYGLVELFARITAKFEDGHCAPALNQRIFAAAFAQPRFLPLALLHEEDEVYVRPDAPMLGGVRLLRINGHQVDSLFRGMQAGVGGSRAWKRARSLIGFAPNLFFSGLRPPFRISYSRDGVVRDTTLGEGMDFAHAVGLNLPNVAGPAYDFRIVENRVGYLDFRSMSGNWEDAAHYFDSCFALMKDRKVRTLAIDLRSNTGGNSVLGDLLVSYFFKKPYRMAGKKYWRISEHYKQYLLRRGDTSHPYLKQPNNTIWVQGNGKPEPSPFRNDQIFEGEVYLITGPVTFSSANWLADAFRTYRMGTIVGEPTGEWTNDFGEVYPFRLPQSGIVINTTTSYDIGCENLPGKRETVPPHVRIHRSLDDIRAGKDPALEWIVKKAGRRD